MLFRTPLVSAIAQRRSMNSDGWSAPAKFFWTCRKPSRRVKKSDRDLDQGSELLGGGEEIAGEEEFADFLPIDFSEIEA